MNNNLVQRILTALVAGSVTIAAILYSPYGLWLFCTIVALLGLWEMLGLLSVKSRRYRWVAMAFAVFVWVMLLLEIVADTLFEIPDTPYILTGVMLLPTLVLIMLFDTKIAQPIQVLGSVLASVVYCYLPFFLLYRMSVPEIAAEYNAAIPMGILGLTWVLDSGAYFVGRFLGKRPLFPRISPKKTWEGAIGAVVICVGVGVLLDQLLMPSDFRWVVVAAIISIVSQLGDLVESMFKRSLAIKDSGTILPGHGGILDRFDGIYVSVPFLFLYFSLI
ncbi:MAG: phosphatidate cytidylyltransferase [Bacteroidia bacterium]|nr:phosphatidate cytidylyltransferase [Bacteroidia bacterium]